ncbi:MAG: GNAT family N-acetyltransferase [Nocardioidaceae bacterium]
MTRSAGPADAGVIAQTVAEAFDGYRDWAPAGWAPPESSVGEPGRAALAAALGRPGVWCLLAFDDRMPAGHVALSPFTFVQPEAAPPGSVNLWQLFVRPPWQGSGLASALLDAAVAEAVERGNARMRLWTPRGAGRARRFYEREGWTTTGDVRDDSPLGLPVVEYERRLGPSGVGQPLPARD